MIPPRKAISPPARSWQNKSATDAVRVKRGSTTIIFALRVRLASTAHLKPQGWFSAGFPPMISIMSVFLMSTHPLVMAPRPKVGPKLETWGPHLRLQQAPLIQNILFERSSFGAERAAIDGVVRVAFDVHHLRGDILRAVTDRIDDDPAAHRAVGTGRARLVGAGDFQRAQL